MTDHILKSYFFDPFEPPPRFCMNCLRKGKEVETNMVTYTGILLCPKCMTIWKKAQMKLEKANEFRPASADDAGNMFHSSMISEELRRIFD